MLSDGRQVIRDSQQKSKNEFIRKEDVRGHRVGIASLKSQEARNASRLISVTNELIKATDKIEAMELASVNAHVGDDAGSKKEIAYLEGKVKAVEGQIYLIQNSLGADLVNSEMLT